jgi:hypothetical protein
MTSGMTIRHAGATINQPGVKTAFSQTLPLIARKVVHRITHVNSIQQQWWVPIPGITATVAAITTTAISTNVRTLG